MSALHAIPGHGSAAFSIAAIVGQMVQLVRESVVQAFLPSMSRQEAAGDLRGMMQMNSRANLLVEGLRLPREPGRVIAIGASLRIETTVETEPCERMDALRPGLRAALTPDWRGGVCGRVLTDGEIAVGDEVRIEE